MSGIVYGSVMSYDSIPEVSSVCLLQNVPYQVLLIQLLMIDGRDAIFNTFSNLDEVEQFRNLVPPKEERAILKSRELKLGSERPEANDRGPKPIDI